MLRTEVLSNNIQHKLRNINLKPKKGMTWKQLKFLKIKDLILFKNKSWDCWRSNTKLDLQFKEKLSGVTVKIYAPRFWKKAEI